MNSEHTFKNWKGGQKCKGRETKKIGMNNNWKKCSCKRKHIKIGRSSMDEEDEKREKRKWTTY